jgi:hypothetical protein
VLLRALFLLLAFATLTETIVAGAHALAGAMLKEQAATALRQQLDGSIVQAQAAVASAIAGGADPRSVQPSAPAASVTCALAAANGCAIETTATVSFATAPTTSPTPCPHGQCSIYNQGNDRIDEGRIAATIAARALAPNGTVLAERSGQAIFRTMRVAPYAVQAGALDESLAAFDGAGAGDDGGAVPTDGSPGTLIDVVYVDTRNGKSMPANVWRAQTQTQAATASAWRP